MHLSEKRAIFTVKMKHRFLIATGRISGNAGRRLRMIWNPFLEKQRRTEYEDLVAIYNFFAAFFDAKNGVHPARKIFKGSLEILKMYGEDSLARRSFRIFAYGKGLERPKAKLWNMMIRGFATAMHLHLYLPLAVGIMLLVDCRIDERLSDTGMRE